MIGRSGHERPVAARTARIALSSSLTSVASNQIWITNLVRQWARFDYKKRESMRADRIVVVDHAIPTLCDWQWQRRILFRLNTQKDWASGSGYSNCNRPADPDVCCTSPQVKGFNTGTPSCLKCRTLFVTTVRPCSNAVAAINMSAFV